MQKAGASLAIAVAAAKAPLADEVGGEALKPAKSEYLGANDIVAETVKMQQSLRDRTKAAVAVNKRNRQIGCSTCGETRGQLFRNPSTSGERTYSCGKHRAAVQSLRKKVGAK